MGAGLFDRFCGVDWPGAERSSAQTVYLAEARQGPAGVEVIRVTRARDRTAAAEFLAGRPFAAAPGWEEWPAPERLDHERRALVGRDLAVRLPGRFRLPQLARAGGGGGPAPWRAPPRPRSVA